MIPNVFVQNWSPSTGYGRMANELADRAEFVAGGHVNRIGEGSPNTNVVPGLGGVLMGYPSFFGDFGALAQIGVRMALTMFESTKLPDDWIAPLNALDAVVVPCSWCADVFRNSGVTTPIHVVPLGISPAFRYDSRRVQDKFRILAIGDKNSWIRKGTHRAMWAFMKAFGDSTDVELVIKSKDGPMFESVLNPNIALVDADYDERQLNDFYHSFDLMVFPSCGEGFGLPPREFAATGGLVIATDFSGTGADLPQWGIPLGYKLASAWQGHDVNVGIGEWAEADVDQLASLMLWARALPVSIRNSLGRFYSANALSLYSWQQYADQIQGIWELYANRRAA